MVSKLSVVCNESGEVFRVLPSDDRASLKDLHKQSGEMPNKREYCQWCSITVKRMVPKDMDV